LGNPLIVLASLCEAYGWTLPEAMQLTLPQIILLNHATYVNRENMERKFDAKKQLEDNGETDEVRADRSRVGDMKSEDLVGYVMAGW
jgi:hypothetical protein